MKFRQAKKIMNGNSSVINKYRRKRPAVDGVYPSLHDVDVIIRARKCYLHHLKRNKKRWQIKYIRAISGK